MTTRTNGKPKVLAQHTPRRGADMKWLQQLLAELGVGNWLRRGQDDGSRLSYRKTQLVQEENGQLTLSVQLELEEDNIPL